MPRAAAQVARVTRVVVLRTRMPFALGVLRERCEKDAFVLSAGPYSFPYAAALELACLVHRNNLPSNPDAAGLSRAAMAHSLRGLALLDAQIVAPRLDWLDASSLELLADLLEFAELAGARLRLLAGLPAFAPEPKLARLLAMAQCADEDFDEPKPRALNTHDNALLAALRAAPMPLAPGKLMHVSGLRAREFNAALRKLSAAGYADAGPRVGLGAASEALPPLEITRWREAALDVCDLPDARLSVNAALGLAGPEAAQLARRALSEGEHALALARFALVPRAAREPLQHALALAGCGHSQAALAILNAEQGAPIDRARVDAALWPRGAMARTQAERELRAAERATRGTAGEVDAATLRARLLLAADKGAAALKLLRRIPASQAQQSPPRIRAGYLVQLALAWRLAGREDKARVLLSEAQKLNLPPAAALGVELCAFECGCCSPARLAESAARALNVEAARRALAASQSARMALRHALGESALAAPASLPQSPEDALALCMRHGAIIAAAMVEGELRVLPAQAQARPGLCAWLEAQLARMETSPALLVPLNSATREFKADTLLLMPRLGGAGPLLALFAKPANAAPLLKLVNAREVVRHWLEAGLLSAEDLHILLESQSGDSSPWPTSPPNSLPSNEPLTSR